MTFPKYRAIKTHFKMTYKANIPISLDSTVEKVRSCIKVEIENGIGRHLCWGKYITNIVSSSILKLIEDFIETSK